MYIQDSDKSPSQYNLCDLSYDQLMIIQNALLGLSWRTDEQARYRPTDELVKYNSDITTLYNGYTDALREKFNMREK